MLKNTKELHPRDLYLNRLIAFQDTEPVKIISGIRRCGKSSLLKLMALHLRQSGITDDQIIGSCGWGNGEWRSWKSR